MAISATYNEWVLTLKNLLLPIFCKWCGQRLLTEDNGYFCPTCWELSPRIQRPFCTICGQPHTAAIGFGSLSNFPCAKCREDRPKYIRRICGAAYYQDSIALAIKLFKFYDKPRLARVLAELMEDFALAEMDCGEYDYLIPVPLHKIRERDRGFNQSKYLANKVLPVFKNAKLDFSLKRIRPTRIQSRLKDEKERHANIRGAFAVIEGEYLEGKTVLLIDDVVTTSGTVSECARALNRAGVKTVDVLAIALAVTESN